MPEILEKPVNLEIPNRLRCAVCDNVNVQFLAKNHSRRSAKLECQHAFESWHSQAERLQLEIYFTASPSLKRILTADLEQILTTRSTF